MIIGGLIKLLLIILNGVLFFFPTFDLPDAADLSAFKVIAWLIPINEIITLTSVIVALVILSVSYFGVNWVANKVRGSG